MLGNPMFPSALQLTARCQEDVWFKSNPSVWNISMKSDPPSTEETKCEKAIRGIDRRTIPHVEKSDSHLIV
jgi:hypothetical protein